MESANYRGKPPENWVPMLEMMDGRLLKGRVGMTHGAALDEAEAERVRLESEGHRVKNVGAWNRTP